MFLITEDPSSGSVVQYLAKITKMVLTLTWTTSMSTDTIEPFL